MRFLNVGMISLLFLLSSASYSKTDTFDSPAFDSGKEQSFEFMLTAEQKAEVWGLTKEHWKRYETLMQGDAKFQFSNLDPIEVLGIYADTDQERKYFADMLIRRNYHRFNRALSFNDAYTQAGIDFIGDEPLLNLDKFYAAYGIEAPQKRKNLKPILGDTLVLFTSPSKPKTLSSFQKMKNLMSLAPVRLEIYFIDTTDSEVIQKWANRAKIDLSLVNDGEITLNIDNGESNIFQVGEKSHAGFIVRGERAIVVDL